MNVLSLMFIIFVLCFIMCINYAISIHEDLDNLNDWFKANQLSVNPSNTKYILFTKRCGVDDQMHNLYIEGTILERVPCTKFLGLYIDEHLSWKQHIDHCKKKMSSGIYAMNMAKHILSINHLRTLYYTHTYGIRLWGNTYQKHTKKLEVLQKRALRVMTGSKYNDPSSPLFKCMHILKLKDIHNLHVEQFIYEFVNGMLPLPRVPKLKKKIKIRATRRIMEDY